MENCKIFCKAQTAIRFKKTIQSLTHSPQKKLDKALLRLLNKNSFKGVLRNIQLFAFKMLQECRSWASRNVVQSKYFLCNQK